MSVPLFLDSGNYLEFEKLAMPVALSDNPESWQREVASEIYKQVPFIGDYAVNVVIERVSPERGYGFGSAEVTAKSDAPTEEQITLPKIKIPLLIRDRQLLPMDVFIEGDKVYPLTESRLHEHLFRTATFETSTRDPQDKGMVSDLYPPMRTNYGNNMMSSDGGTMAKFAADAFVESLNAPEAPTKKNKTIKDFSREDPIEKTDGDPTAYMRQLKREGGAQKFASKGPLLDAISSTVSQAEVNSFISHVTDDQQLKIAAHKNPTFKKALFKIAAFKNIGIEKTAEALVNGIKPTVIQLTKLASGDWNMKWANIGAYKTAEATIDQGQAASMAGDEVEEKAPGGTITLSTNLAKKTTLDSEKIELVKEFGCWKVWNSEGNAEMYGWVFPTIDLDMQPLDLFVFVEMQGQTYSVQSEIAGVRLHEGLDSLDALRNKNAQITGDGVFLTSGNSPIAIGPFTISNGAQVGGQQEYHAETAWGEQIVLLPTDGINEIQAITENTYAIPTGLSWIPLPTQPILLVDDPLDVKGLGEAQQAPGTANVGSTGHDEFNIDGPPVDKLASADKHFIKRAEAEFLLVGMGAHPAYAADILDCASAGEKVKVAGLLPITPLSHVHGQMVKKAGIVLKNFPYHLRRNLVKEAAALEDTETADKILAMNFINPENISTFASYLPELDDASSKLAEMLIAARLGLKQVPEGAVESAMRNLEEVIDGVKLLQQKELTD